MRLAILTDHQCPECRATVRKTATADTGWQVTCPSGHTFSVNPSGRGPYQPGDHGNRVFIGQQEESLQHGFHPSQVREAQRLLGEAGHAEAANCIQPDGSVRFSDRAQERRFSEAYHQTRTRNEQRVDEERVRNGLDPMER